MTAFADDLTVLRKGRFRRRRKGAETTTETMATMMIGDTPLRERAARFERTQAPVVLDIGGVFADADDGRPAVAGVSLKIRAGEILGIAGASPATGQSALVEVLSGQRPMRLGDIRIHGEVFEPDRPSKERFKLFGLPEEPLKNAAVAGMTGGGEQRLPDLRPGADRDLRRLAQAAPIRRQAQALSQALPASNALARRADRPASRRQRPSAPCWRANCPGRSMC